MANIYITEQRSILRKTGDRLLVQKDDRVILDIQCHKVDAVLIFGNVQFTTQAVHEILEHDIEMAIFTRRGRLVGQITSPATKNIMLRLAQFRCYENPVFRLNISKAIVKAKISNCLFLIKKFAYNHPDKKLKNDIKTIQQYLRASDLAENLQQLLGIEGGAAKAYYNAFAKMILNPFPFEGRKKRPPPDPVNALLSFAYTLIFNEISSLLDGMGFEPYLGFFHKPDYGRPSLACDLIEEFRPIAADRLVLNLINNHILTLQDFTHHSTGKGVYLSRNGMKKFFKEYERVLNREFKHPQNETLISLRRCFRLQATAMAQSLKTNSIYTPLLMQKNT